uniref:Uncharacterized protein n=2 Tax=Opuntia streptacantha TaxID=393608 RepID=A0A7C8ZSZ6_OPUST
MFQILQPQKRRKQPSMETKTTDSKAITSDQTISSTIEIPRAAAAGHRRRLCGSHRHWRSDSELKPDQVVGVNNEIPCSSHLAVVEADHHWNAISLSLSHFLFLKLGEF